jgi:hypothetical protein
MRRLLNRRWFSLAMLALIGIIGAGYLLIPANEFGVSTANFKTIQPGWTAKQVEELLGRCILSVTDSEGPIIADDAGRVLTSTTWSVWRDEDGNTIQVDFDYRGVVTDKTFVASDLSLCARVKRRIERRLKSLSP